MALTLTRRINQTIRIGEAVVTVRRIKGRYVRLSIEAERSTRIVRGEIDERKEKVA